LNNLGLTKLELNEIKGGSYSQLVRFLELLHHPGDPFFEPTGAFMPLPYSQAEGPASC